MSIFFLHIHQNFLWIYSRVANFVESGYNVSHVSNHIISIIFISYSNNFIDSMSRMW